MTAVIAKSASRWPDAGPDFNHDAANAVFETIMKMDDGEARLFAGIVHGAIIQRDLACYATDIAKAANAYYRERVETVSKALLQGAISKSADGGDATAEMYALEVISKATESAEEYAEVARKRKRDLGTGRFVTDHRDIAHDGTAPLTAQQAAVLGIKTPAERLTKAQLANFQRGYHQVTQMLSQYGELPAKDAVLHFHYADGTTTQATPLQQDGNGGKELVPPISTPVKTAAGTVRSVGLNPRKTLTGVSLSVVPDISTTGGAYHAAFGAAGLPRTGLVAETAVRPGGFGNAETWNVDNTGSFGDQWTKTIDGDEFAPSRRAFRRLAAGSSALESTLGSAAPAKLKIALKVGQHVGDLGPEAQRVLGPTADKTAYRYRGIERKPDERVVNAVGDVMRRPGLSGQQKHNFLFHGSEDDLGNWRPSAPLAYLRSRLPKTELNTLQRMSGVIPPSEGIIVNREGKVTAQAVGYGDDHYLPFNLKKLAGLRGGEYLRTRTWGGPTTEDIYTGLVGGAKSLGVVSHNGVYTIEFDDNLKGGRRFNDKAARMVARYGQLLDAVKSEQVTTGGIHPSRLAELAASNRYDQDEEPEAYDREWDRLRTAEKRNPKLSQKQIAEAGNEFFANLAARRNTADGHTMSAEELTSDWAGVRAAQDYARDAKHYNDTNLNTHAIPNPSIAERKAAILAGLEDRDPVVAQRNLAEAMGATKQYDKAIKTATDDYRATLKPLALDAQGYQLALNALQEQFPYYIKRVDYHPWVDAKNGRDTGYVMPKHNRPAEVLAGYFDKDIAGGKAYAHTVRFQNGHAVRRVQTSSERQAKMREKITGRASSASSEPGRVDPKVAEELSRNATERLVEHIQGLRSSTFSGEVGRGHAKEADFQRELANQPVMGNEEMLRSLGIHHFLTADRDTLRTEAAKSPSAFKARLDHAIKQAEDYHLFHLDPGIVHSFRVGGAESGPTELPEDLSGALRDKPDAEYNFDHLSPVFSRDRAPSKEDVIDRYISDPLIKRLPDMPASPADGVAFNDALRTLAAKNSQDRAAYYTWKAGSDAGRNVGTQPVKLADVDERAEGILRAKQLGRRYREAVERETRTSVSAAPPNKTYTVVDATNMTPEDLRGALGAGSVNSDGGTFRDRNGISYTGD